MHHLDSWIKIDQLDFTCFIISLLTAQHVSNVSTSILRSLRLICWVISCVVLLWFDVCWCYGVVRLGWCGILMQAEALVPLFHYLLLNMFRMLVHPFSGACDLFVKLFYGLYCSGSMCVGVTVWFGWGGVVSGCTLKPVFGYHTTPAEPHRNTNTHRTRAIQPMK